MFFSRTLLLGHMGQQERYALLREPQYVLREPLFAEEGRVTISQGAPEQINPSEGAV